MSGLKVGVAIPAYNAMQWIGRCLVSVEAQTYENTHAYVALDGCTDYTEHRLREHPTWWRQLEVLPERRGWPTALNAAAAAAIEDGCDVVVTLDSDNYLRNDAIELMVRKIAQGADWVVAHSREVGGRNALQVPLRRFPLTLADFGGPHCPIMAFAMIRSPIWVDLGGYDVGASLPDSYGYCEDWDFYIRMLKARYTHGMLVPEPVQFYVMHPEQLHREGVRRHAEARSILMARHPEVFDTSKWPPRCGCGCI